ncbi:MAG: Stk1 family PASTA domain-containing Ser/Thr kinase [Ilumatobacteraceae bacterium]
MADNPSLINDRYDLGESIGRGGMAEVFLAHDILLDRPIALKVLFAEYATDPAFVERFRREAQSAANLTHPNIVGVYDWGRVESTYFIAMEYIQGRTLAAILAERKKLTAIQATEIAIKIAAALGAAHDKGVVHRDIKPGNILISSDGQVKVADFGIARAFGSDVADALTQAGSVMGTATYFSPEQAQGGQPDPRSDIYSLGIVMYEMIAGRTPFFGDNAVGVAYQQVHNAPPPLHEFAPDVPNAFEAIVAKCLAKSPKRRYANAAALRDDLRRFINGEEVRALTEVRGTSSMLNAEETLALPTTPATKSKDDEDYPPYDDLVPQRTALYVFGAVFIAFILLAGGIFLYRTLASGGSTASITIPDVTNRSLADASALLLDLGLTPIPNAVPRDDIGDDIVYAQDPPPSVGARTGDTVTLTYNPASAKVMVPAIQGLLVKDATAVLAPLGLQLTIAEVRNDPLVPLNQIITQDPPATTQVRSGSAVSVVVSGGNGGQVIPNVQGQVAAAAQQLLQGVPYNFVITITEENSSTIERGRVIRTEPAIGVSLAPGSPLTMFISKGVSTVAVPSVETLTETDARAQLNAVGLVAEVKYQDVPSGDPSDGRVISQGTQAGTQVEPGTPVKITVGRGVVTTTTTTM